jgi:NADH dehydrogenase FAD-containing subunit
MNANSTVIVGGGFVGLFTALRLSHHRYPNPVILIDSEARFVFKPLLYEYLSEEMQEEQVVPTYEELLRDSKISFVQDKATKIDLQKRQVMLASGRHYDYRYLVLAVGSIQGYFSVDGAQENAFPFRTRIDALNLKQHLQDCLERASQIGDRAQRQNLLTVAVIGAGPSGVELSTTLADLLPEWYGQLGGDIQEIRIVLVDHNDEILKGDINAHLQETALQALKSCTVPVELLLGVSVEAVDRDCLRYCAKDRTQAQDRTAQESLLSATTIWATGTATNPLLEALPLPADSVDKHKHPLVTSTLQLLNFPEVFAAGDCAVMHSHPLPQIAQIAYQQGVGIADNIMALSDGEPPQPIQAKLRGTLMKLGIHKSVANLFDKIQINGEAGYLIRNTTYLEMLPLPAHNFKVTKEWIRDEIFERYSPPQSKESNQSHHPQLRKPSQPSRTAIWMGGLALAAMIGIGLTLTWRSQQPYLSNPSPASQPANSK